VPKIELFERRLKKTAVAQIKMGSIILCGLFQIVWL